MKTRVFGLALLGLGLIVGWWCLSPPAASQPAGEGGKEGVKAGRYQYVSGGLITVVMVDTQTGKTYALSSPQMFGGRFDSDQPPEFAWIPIEKFEDLDAYRKWMRERRESWMRERYKFSTTTTTRFFPKTTTTDFPTTRVATTEKFFGTTTTSPAPPTTTRHGTTSTGFSR